MKNELTKEEIRFLLPFVDEIINAMNEEDKNVINGFSYTDMLKLSMKLLNQLEDLSDAT